MINLVFPHNGRSSFSTSFKCLSPKVVPGDEVSTEHEVTALFGRKYSTNNYTKKEVTIQKLPADHAYFMDQCCTHVRLIKIHSTVRYFFPKNSQHIDLILPHMEELLSRKILVLTPAPAVPPNPSIITRIPREDGTEAIIYHGDIRNSYLSLSKPRLISQSGENISGPLMHLALPNREASHNSYPWVINGNNSVSNRSDSRYCDFCRVIATKTFYYNKISYDDLTVIINAIQEKKLTDMLRTHCEYTKSNKSNAEKFTDHLYNKLLITHFRAPLKPISILSRKYIEILQEEIDSGTLLLKKESISDLKNTRKDFVNKLSSALNMVRKIDNFEKQHEGIFQKYFDKLSHLLTVRLSILSSISIPFSLPTEKIEEAIITTFIPILEEHLNEMDFTYIDPDNPIVMLNSTLMSYKYNPQIPKFDDATRVDSITQVGDSLLGRLTLWNQKLEKLHKQSTNPGNNAFDELLTQYVTNPTLEAADFGSSSLATTKAQALKSL